VSVKFSSRLFVTHFRPFSVTSWSLC